MSTHKHVDMICLALCLVILVVVSGLLLWKYPQAQTVSAAVSEPAYAAGLFSSDQVHTIDITMEDWEGFLETCETEEYAMCTAVIDGEVVRDIAIRAKGNTSLSSVKNYGSDRYSFKMEFDHYQEGGNFQGLDKLSLNNLIQDNTYLKDYLTYQMMDAFGVDAPLCSYVYLTVNGEDWGLYLAVEGVEESFLERNYGGTQGELYKPDSMDMGGGRGAGGDFQMPEDFDPSAVTPPEGMELPSEGEVPQRGERGDPKDGFGGMGSDDVKLVYTDDDFDSYANIFDNAKTDVTDADKTRLIQSLKILNEGTEVETVVDVEEVIRYFVVHNFVCNFDSYTGAMVHNYYLYEEDGVLSMIPWDYNLAFGGFQSMVDATELVNYPIDAPVSGGSTEDRPMIHWIFQREEYTDQYHRYFAQFLEVFTSGAFAAELDRVAEMIAPYVEQDPTKFCTYEDFQAGVETLREFCLLRAESIQGQLAGRDTQVDASHLTISDMGSMGNMGGGQGSVGTTPHQGEAFGGGPGGKPSPWGEGGMAKP